MRKFITFLVLIFASVVLAIPSTMVQLETINDLKAYPPITTIGQKTSIFVLGKDTMFDGKGGFYQWDPSSTAAEDMSFLNVITSPSSATGRWTRIFQRTRNVPQGVLIQNGGVKTLYVQTVTDANGYATINLTTDNTPSGPAIFTEVWKNDSRARTTASTQNEAVSSYIRVPAEATSLKTTTHGYFKINAVTLTLGLLYNPAGAAAAGIPVNFEVVGI